MNRRLPFVLLSVAALVVAPAAAASATGGGFHHNDYGVPSYWGGHDEKHDDKHDKDAPRPTAMPTDLCGGSRVGDEIRWDRYTCAKATGYFLYRKLDLAKPAGFWNSGPQDRVALHATWAWPTDDKHARKEASKRLPRDAQIIPLQLEATALAAVCAEPDAFGLQVDLVGNGEAGRVLDVASLVPTRITPPDGGFPVPRTLAYYGHYEVPQLLDLETLCATGGGYPTPTPTVTAAPTPTPSPVVTLPPVPTPTPSETAEVLPAPAETPSPAASPAPTATAVAAPAPTPKPTERAEVLSATADRKGGTLAATGAQTAVGLLAAVAAIAGGAALVLARRRHRAES